MLVGEEPRSSVAMLPSSCACGIEGRAGHQHRRRHDRLVLQRVDRVDAVLRRLDQDAVLHAPLGVLPEVGVLLRRAAERDQHVVGHIVLGQARVARLRPVDVHEEGGGVRHLLQADVGRAGQAGHRGGDPLGHREIPRLVREAPLDLDVDRGREPEIKHLGDDIGRGEVKGQVRKFGLQVGAQLVHVILGRPVALLKRDEDFSIRR